jgi:hypothetical protein
MPSISHQRTLTVAVKVGLEKMVLADRAFSSAIPRCYRDADLPNCWSTVRIYPFPIEFLLARFAPVLGLTHAYD